MSVIESSVKQVLLEFFFLNMDSLGEIGAFTLVKVQFPVQLLLQIFAQCFPLGKLAHFSTSVGAGLGSCEVKQTSISTHPVLPPRQQLPLGVFWPRLHLSPLVALQVPVAASASSTGRISNAARSRGAVTSIKSILTLY